MNILIFSILYGSAFSYSADKLSNAVKVSALLARDDCESNPDWQPTQAAWIKDNTDKSLASWWQNISSKTPNSFANELGRGFGGHSNGFACGILDYATCAAPTCTGTYLNIH
jgi:hypothetical protein